MEKEYIEKLIRNCGIEVVRGEVYNVFECCVKNINFGVRIKDKAPACQEHSGALLTKFKICTACGHTIIGRLAKKGKTCQNCRKYDKSDKWEHKRGMYCRHYVVEEHGCWVCDDCWYCDGFFPIFKGTGPKQKTRRL